MATKKAEYYKFNQGENVWDLYYFKTSADAIVETANKKVLTSDEREKISENLSSFNGVNKLVKLDGNGKILSALIPSLPYLSTVGGTVGELEVTGPADFGSVTMSDVLINGEISSNTGTLTFSLTEIDFDGGLLRNIGSPSDPTDAANREYVDNKVSSGFTTKAPVKAASIAHVDITAVLNTLDGVTLNANDRVLLKHQEAENENGVYKLNSSKKPVIVTDDSAIGSAVFVEYGDTNNDYIYHCSTQSNWVAFSKPDTIKDGAGLTKSGTTLSIATGGVKDSMIDSVNPAKLESFEADDTTAAAWTNLPNASTNVALLNHINALYSAIKLLRGTESYNTFDAPYNNQTIAGAYDKAAQAQATALNALETIPQITSGSANPSITNDTKNGDLYFKELSTV